MLKMLIARLLKWGLTILGISVLSLGVYTSEAGLFSGPTVQPTLLPPNPSPTPLNCVQNSQDVSLQVVSSPDSQASFPKTRLVGKGFMPYEKLYIVIEANGVNHSTRLETFDFSVAADGDFTNSISIQLNEPIHGQVVAVHQRGVACVSFTIG